MCSRKDIKTRQGSANMHSGLDIEDSAKHALRTGHRRQCKTCTQNRTWKAVQNMHSGLNICVMKGCAKQTLVAGYQHTTRHEITCTQGMTWHALRTVQPKNIAKTALQTRRKCNLCNVGVAKKSFSKHINMGSKFELYETSMAIKIDHDLDTRFTKHFIFRI